MNRLLVLFSLVISTFVAAGQSVPPLINYQGRLTDETGAALAPGSYGIQFRLWASPTGTNTNDLIWAQQQNAVVFSNGVFNVILGAPGGSPILGVTAKVNDLSLAFTDPNRYLGITLVSRGSTPLTASTEIIPRQQILSTPFALTAASAATAVSAATAASVLPGSIKNESLTGGLIQITNLAPRQIQTTSAGIGNIAFSKSSGTQANIRLTSPESPLPDLSVTLVTTGRPVLVFLSSVEPTLPLVGGNRGTSSFLGPNSGSLYIHIYRTTPLSKTLVSRNFFGSYYAGSSAGAVDLPPSCIQFIDSPRAGTNSYSVTVSSDDGSLFDIFNVRLVALEL